MIPLQKLTDGSLTAQNFDALARLVIDTGGRTLHVRVGTGTATWPGGASISNAATVSHGLPATPVFVAVCGSTNQGEVVAYHAYSYGATSFVTEGEFVAGFTPAAAATSNFVWLAIG